MSMCDDLQAETLKIYEPRMGLPWHWRDLAGHPCHEAIMRFFSFMAGHRDQLEERDVENVVAYAQHVINAPCYDRFPEVAPLRERAKSLASVDDLERWITCCLSAGIDPF